MDAYHKSGVFRNWEGDFFSLSTSIRLPGFTIGCERLNDRDKVGEQLGVNDGYCYKIGEACARDHQSSSMSILAELPASFAFPDDFPPELLTQILLQVPYWDLMRVVPLVSKLWKYTIETEPALRMRMFKKASLSDSEMYGDNVRQLQLHPLIGLVLYMFGDDVSEACLLKDEDAEDDEDEDDSGASEESELPAWKLPSLSAANDLATIPVVYTLSIGVKFGSGDDHVTFDTVENPNGITVLDVFGGLADGSQKTVDTADGPQTLEDVLGEDGLLFLPLSHRNCHAESSYRYYRGFYNLTRTGRHLTTELYLEGAIPVPVGFYGPGLPPPDPV
ncbi:hypothetical protein C8F01DRAFT_1338095 [Mycena amicta]|nr:hypothetical protein C8F01DRAFT_1338095 [Mycena amicta]